MYRFIGLLCLMLAAGSAAADANQARARLSLFESELEVNPSATAVLQHWCDRHARGARIVARRLQVLADPPEDARKSLGLKPGERIGYRRVQLMCGSDVLSNADNWYLPDKLTDAMNKTLANTDTPFGVVVAPLHFRRRNLETCFLSPPADGVLRHSAVLLTAKGEPFSFVMETYTSEILR